MTDVTSSAPDPQPGSNIVPFPTPAPAKESKKSRRGHHEGNIRRRTDGRWEARVPLPDGTRKSLYGPTKAAVTQKLRDLQKQLDAGLDPNAGKQRLDAFLQTWLNEVVRPTCRPKTLATYREHVELYLIPDLGRHPLNKLTVQHVQRMLNAHQTRGLGPTTLAYIRTILKVALNVAIRWGLIGRNVAALTSLPPATRSSRQKPLTAEEALCFQEQIRGDRHEALFLTTLTLGLRPAEVLGLRWQDVDFDRGRIRIVQTVQYIKGTWYFGEPKTRDGKRTLPLPRFLADLLRRHQEAQRRHREEVVEDWRELDLVFPDDAGFPQKQPTVLVRFKATLTRAGIEPRRVYDLRHSCATFLYANGVAPRTIMEILGHSKIAITMNTYVHGVDSVTATALDTFEQMFGNPESPARKGVRRGSNASNRRPRRLRDRESIGANPGDRGDAGTGPNRS